MNSKVFKNGLVMHRKLQIQDLVGKMRFCFLLQRITYNISLKFLSLIEVYHFPTHIFVNKIRATKLIYQLRA